MQFPFRLGSRGSPLALIQARIVATALCSAHGWSEEAVIIVPIRTSGDKNRHQALADIGGKSLWTKELDTALTAGEIDAAVHSMKDVETFRPDHISIAAMLARADVHDRLIGAPSLETLPLGACVGTASPRRAAQIRHRRSDIQIKLLRGNVATRLQKLEDKAFDATLLAAAGLIRLGKGDIGYTIPLSEMLPAAGQGAIGIEALANSAAWSIIAAIDHQPTHRAVDTERQLLMRLNADCHSPIAAFAEVKENGIRLRACLYTADGQLSTAIDKFILQPSDAFDVGTLLLNQAPPELKSLFKVDVSFTG
ncbi:hydroxymethylbilane synthase [Zymomonas mobilis]|uniref:Hydroxymethylbilane synthase n=1 Tax=Zymomonas mobilis subsp. pomaceae (strain ATCC 29192 / DSM 22645 / JCM 10191 / CCUG 17912 / NBRC 13757 / NCIMB 11200 / NRRL B-4491 / Barker I) TaxID=579138 RepID=F8EU92_ZYMMT|nr:hydroxymethylbilane synthase [Zymomonas mobilis]AEI38113.1 porphobilinogen deaminase [Zymomonas mobilis subsp. pomaceae ATCC 29192]MDX5949479.1 hydroxymethylbilane synthase [Zymomonas mobilis subsp. pomaceae]GEB89222.1 porphobilinogen deaminase [Zymomonas mobilis subsp. pomaceae]